MKISITVYDDNYKKVFSVVKIDLRAGMFRLSSYLQDTIGMPLKVVQTDKNGNMCYICKKPIKKGQGMMYEGKAIHQACLMVARQSVDFGETRRWYPKRRSGKKHE